MDDRTMLTPSETTSSLPAEPTFALTLPERLDRASASILASASERLSVDNSADDSADNSAGDSGTTIRRISFARTRRLDASGLEALRVFCKHAQSRGERVSLELLSSEIYSLLSLCGFPSICDLSLVPEDSGGILP